MKLERIWNVLTNVVNEIEPVAAARIAAAVVYRNEIVSIGFNQRKTHPFQSRFSKHKDSIYWHAETKAIHEARKVLTDKELEKCSIVILRIKNEENTDNQIWGMSRPCCGCMSCIREFGIKKVIYSMDQVDNSVEYGIIEL